ncbi:Adenosylmethionine-8-amino-7-oxononanoate aminotransferase [Planctomycetales bacterium 10988]|nr:Adenosylmethionine-8-amino-7-oxononanoate aminotransferase [Planctomycetales bacterium 10988]
MPSKVPNSPLPSSEPRPATSPWTPDRYRQVDRETYWHPFTQMAEYEPFIIERAEGFYLIDIDGNRYLDAVSSLWCNVHGHRHPKLDQAIRDQLDRVAHSTQLGFSNTTTIQLAKKIVDLAPDGLEHVFFSDSGSTAVEVAMKMAFQYWQQRPEPQPQKTRFIAMGVAYHGDTIGNVSVGGVDLFHKIFKPLLFEAFRIPAPFAYRPPEGVASEDVLQHSLQTAEAILKEHHHEIAALVVEPLIQGAAGMIVHPEGFLKELRALTKKYNVLMICDEVFVGIGRMGTMFACEQEGVVPDLLCLAKGISAGYLPVAATLASTEIYNAFLGTFGELRTFYHGHTFGGNPLGAAVSLANLELIEETQLLESMPTKIERLQEHLAEIKELPHVGDVRQRGFAAGVELVQDKATKEPYPYEEKWGYQVCDEAIRRGVLLRPLGNVVVIVPPLALPLDEIDKIGQTLKAAIQAVTEGKGT